MSPAITAPVRRWLFLCCGMIFAMAIIGAITRLTESGLSIVTWQPIKDMLPPLNEAAWQQAFAEYQRIPQYRLLNHGMSLEEFKNIYFWEWLHRLWGRLIGLVYAVPFFWFVWRGKLTRKLQLKLWIGLVLGGLQGAVGWFMVASGLSELVYVSHLRLALHLSLALVIYAYLLWLALDLQSPSRQQPPRGVMLHGWLVLAALGITIIWGAFVAGLKAGWVYNSFPLMDGALLPDAAWTLRPLWQNIFNNTALVQFLHRWLAIGTGLLVWSWCWRLWHRVPQRWPVLALALMVAVQIVLGIATLLQGVPVWLGALHQAGAIILLTLLLLNLHRQGQDISLVICPPERDKSPHGST